VEARFSAGACWPTQIAARTNGPKAIAMVSAEMRNSGKRVFRDRPTDMGSLIDSLVALAPQRELRVQRSIQSLHDTPPIERLRQMVALLVH
jgi:hypothetical protein